LHNGLDDAGDVDGGGPVVVDEEEVERGMKEFEEKLKLSSFSHKRELEKQKRLSMMMAKYSSLSPSSSASGTPGSPTSAARASLLSSGSSASPFASSSLTPHGASSLSSPMTSASPLHASSPFYEEETGERRRELEELRIRLAAKDNEIKRLIREKQEERRKVEEKEKTRREVEEKWQESIAEIEVTHNALTAHTRVRTSLC
jgi:hypothetical protein